jgi:hypothetical protein
MLDWQPDSDGKPLERQLSYLHLLTDCCHPGMAEVQRRVREELPGAVHSLLSFITGLPAHASEYDPDYYTAPSILASVMQAELFAQGKLRAPLSTEDQRFLTERMSLVLPYSGALFTAEAADSMPVSAQLGKLFELCLLPKSSLRPLANSWTGRAQAWLGRVQAAYAAACDEEAAGILNASSLAQAGQTLFWPFSEQAARQRAGCLQPPLALVVALALGCGVRSPPDLDYKEGLEDAAAEDSDGSSSEEESEPEEDAD